MQRSALLLTFIVACMCLRWSPATLTARRYAEFLRDGTTVNGNFTTYQQLSRINCGNLCQNNNTCYIFGWDSATRECLIFTELDSLTLRTPASVTLITYYLLSDPEGYIGTLEFIGEHRNLWTSIRELCVNLGGDLAAPVSPQFCYMLNTVAQQEDIIVGLEQDKTTLEWIDVKGKVFTNFNWDYGEPDGGTQYYSFIREGRLWDINNSNRTYFVPCRVP